MMMRIGTIAILLLGLAVSAVAQQENTASVQGEANRKTDAGSRMQNPVFQSESLGRQMHYRILLPKRYFESDRYYPVLYLLHGWHGDYQNWSTLTNLTFYAENAPIIIVMPDAGDSWYVDSATVPQDKFEQYVIKDVVDEVEHHWRAIRSQHRRAIAGLSMGGYASVNLSLKHPGMFKIAGSISGAFNAALPELEQRADLKPSLVQTFGAANSKTRTENDVYKLASNADPQKTPYMYIDCGSGDVTFAEPNRKLISILAQRKIAFEYHEFPGVHSWQYWDERLPALLKVVEREIAPEMRD
jgi:S-formylglutathione hydrolase FrmB